MSGVSLLDVQHEQAEWQARNFPQAVAGDCFEGIVEEVGELAHARLKARQGIRGDASQHEAAEKDAVGDIAVYLIGYCNLRGFDFERILAETWGQVKGRDWTKNKETGR